jgi:hypothetical protein
MVSLCAFARTGEQGLNESCILRDRGRNKRTNASETLGSRNMFILEAREQGDESGPSVMIVVRRKSWRWTGERSA